MPCSGSNRRVADDGGSPFQRGRVGAAERHDARGVFGHSGVAQLLEQQNCSGSPVSSRRRNAGSPERLRK